MKRILLLSYAFLFVLGSAWAQRTVSGRVTSETDGSGIPGVNVVLKGTTTGTTSDLDGNYRLSVPEEGGTLVFSFIGLATQEVEIGARSVIDLAMSEDVETLSEVVVTAIGIERDKKSLGYAVSQVDGDAVAEKSEGDIGRLLRGKAAGVQVTQQNGMSGSGTNIIIRGYTSVTQSNQPLFIVDGVPFNSSTNQANNFVDGQTESSRFLDLDPNNIESINVLKGLSATVLYGELGRNGVIIVTTKNGARKGKAKKTEVSISQSVFANQIANLPSYQENYGGGFYQNFGFFFSNWGPNFNEIDQVQHPYSAFSDDNLIAAFPEFQDQLYDYRYYESVPNFFRTGLVSTTSINVNGASDNARFNINYGYTDDKGFTPGNQLYRNNFGFGGSVDLTNGITAGGTFNYARTKYKSPPVGYSGGSGTTGDGSSVFGDVFYTPASVDLMGLPFENPLDGSSVYYRSGNDIQNPRWTVKNAKTGQTVDRVYGNAFVRANIIDWINVQYRVGLDAYTESNFYGQNKGGVDGNVLGIYRTIDRRSTVFNQDLILTLNRDINEDLNILGTFGVNGRRDIFSQTGVESTNQVVFGTLRHFNFINQSATNSFSGGGLQIDNDQNWLGVYGQLEFEFKKFVYLTLSARNDWVNTLEQGNNSLFYPGASLAFDLTSAIPALGNSRSIDFLKARVGYGSSAGFPGPFTTRNTLALNSRAFDTGNGVIQTNSVSNRLGNPDLEPERVSEIEVGVEGTMFQNRLNFDISAYNKTTTNLIIDRDLDPSTGFTATNINAGDLKVIGLEANLGGTPVQIGGFDWSLNGNFTAFENTVESLPEGTNEIVYAGFTDLGNFAIAGEPLGVIKGSYIQRDDQGRPLVDATGQYVFSTDQQIIGDPNPDWNATLINTFSWKELSLNVEFQYQQGGDIYSGTARALLARGISTDTDFERRLSFILPGVVAGTDGQPNTTQIAATDLYFNNLGFGPSEMAIYDATHIRLNELSLSYSLPKSLLANTPFGNITVTASGYNLWFEAFNFPDGINFDPNVLGTGVGNGQGFEFLNAPTSRRYGGSVRLTF